MHPQPCARPRDGCRGTRRLEFGLRRGRRGGLLSNKRLRLASPAPAAEPARSAWKCPRPGSPRPPTMRRAARRRSARLRGLKRLRCRWCRGSKLPCTSKRPIFGQSRPPTPTPRRGPTPNRCPRAGPKRRPRGGLEPKRHPCGRLTSRRGGQCQSPTLLQRTTDSRRRTSRRRRRPRGAAPSRRWSAQIPQQRSRVIESHASPPPPTSKRPSPHPTLGLRRPTPRKRTWRGRRGRRRRGPGLCGLVEHELPRHPESSKLGLFCPTPPRRSWRRRRGRRLRRRRRP
mmetsp:Transcript_15634/g.52674  ORF Transcript_15634/g.52674 Transcript_15634/m.52674 type:complete len:285 (+) Transcript_15634:1547-2401(+)